jgi:hypothetical protein
VEGASEQPGHNKLLGAERYRHSQVTASCLVAGQSSQVIAVLVQGVTEQPGHSKQFRYRVLENSQDTASCLSVQAHGVTEPPRCRQLFG